MPTTWSRHLPQAELETLLELGEGGMARAYLARTLGAGGFERLVVLKRLNLRLLGDPDAVERFLAEARVAARIHHANVVGTQQIGRDAAGPFIVLDYIEGGSLDDLVFETKLPIPVILRIALDALSGLRAVHEARDVDGRPLAILHRDVSLQNILVSAHDGVARLADFGVAKSTLGKVHTQEGVLVGKLIYFPPEYLRREPVGPSLDLYALGVTLWLALTRHEPWEDASEAQVVREILDHGIPPLDAKVQVAPEIAAFVMRACERDPRFRFQSAREMAETLERFERERGWLATHAEVAALVSEVLGPELAIRRETVAHRTRSVENPARGESGIARRPEIVSETRRLEATIPIARAAPAAPAPQPRSRRSARLVALVAVVALAGVGALVWAVSFREGTERTEVANQPAENVEQPASTETAPSPQGAAAEAPQSPRSEDVPRPKRAAPQLVPRKASAEPEALRKQNPYRHDSTE
ncbi:MAG TPA: serine/threonine-protein kinase [Polyangiaceae bacterium]